jgi:hypothetical protein
MEIRLTQFVPESLEHHNIIEAIQIQKSYTKERAIQHSKQVISIPLTFGKSITAALISYVK